MESIEQQDGALENTEQVTEQPNWEAKSKDLEAEVAKWKRIADRNAKKADKPEEKSDDKPVKSEPSDFSHGEKALLRAIGIKGADELQLARDYIKRTGEDIDALEGDEIFQARLEKLRTTKANELAASTTNRGNQGANTKENPEYWLAKLGPNESVPLELPFELRQKIVAARRAQSKAGKMFYSD